MVCTVVAPTGKSQEYKTFSVIFLHHEQIEKETLKLRVSKLFTLCSYFYNSNLDIA